MAGPFGFGLPWIAIWYHIITLDSLYTATIWASYQIRKIVGCACSGNAGTFSLSPRVSDPDMHHGTCATHVPCCMSGPLTSGFLWSRRRGKRSWHSRSLRKPQFCVSGKRPMSGANCSQNGPPTIYTTHYIFGFVVICHSYAIMFQSIRVNYQWPNVNFTTCAICSAREYLNWFVHDGLSFVGR